MQGGIDDEVDLSVKNSKIWLSILSYDNDFESYLKNHMHNELYTNNAKLLLF